MKIKLCWEQAELRYQEGNGSPVQAWARSYAPNRKATAQFSNTGKVKKGANRTDCN